MPSQEEEKEIVSKAGDITDKARRITDDDSKLSKIFFSIIDKPIQYVRTIHKILDGKN
jgi:hypothetical protein